MFSDTISAFGEAKEVFQFNDTLKAFNDFKNKQQKCMKQCILICKSIYIRKVSQLHFTLR